MTEFEVAPDDREAYAEMAQSTRSDIICEILAHPYQMPTTAELAHYCDVSESTIRYHIDHLEDLDVIERQQGGRRVYYALTEKGWRILVSSGWVRELPMLRSEFCTRSPPDDIASLAGTQRPEPSFTV